MDGKFRMAYNKKLIRKTSFKKNMIGITFLPDYPLLSIYSINIINTIIQGKNL